MIGLVIALAVATVPQEQTLTVQELTYSETYACAALGVGAQDWAREQIGDAEITAEHQQLLTSLDRLANAAAQALDAAQARDGLTPEQVQEAQTAIFDELGGTDDETLFAMTGLCADIFGVNFE